MSPISKDASAATAMMQDEVVVMEQRLQQLRTTMSAERERRTAAQNSNPSGSQWRSARTDVPTNKYANHALANKPPPQKRRNDAGGEASAMGRTGNRFGLVQPAGEGADMRARDTTAAGNGVAALRASAGTSTVFTHEGDEPAERTRPAGEWQPSFSLPDDSVEYDVLMAPEEPAYSASSGGGGSLLHGTFDEAAERAAFQAAVGQWRGPATAGSSTEELESAMTSLSTHAVPGQVFGAAPPAPALGAHGPGKPATAARGSDDLASLLGGGGGGGGGGELESLMAGLVSQLSSEAKTATAVADGEPHAATLSGGGSTLSGVALD